ncbi:MAG: YdeI/OmpD-associated family protein [Terracidiphilus sp.]|nr:YdeI/OmpD-associated family protein [Terracidiphilus sp.]
MKASAAKSFPAVLERLDSGLGWVVARVPFDAAKAWPERKGMRVRGEIEGFPFRSSLMGYAGGGGHFILVNKKMQAAAKAQVGEKVRIRLQPDLEERAAVVPAELDRALKGEKRLRRWFDGLNYTMRKWIGDTVSEPKAGESRALRAERIAEWLLLTIEGEIDPKDPPPILKAAFQRQPLARAGWEAMTPLRRRNHLLGIFHVQGAEARERRAAKAVEDALKVAGRAATCGGADAR